MAICYHRYLTERVVNFYVVRVVKFLVDEHIIFDNVAGVMPIASITQSDFIHIFINKYFPQLVIGKRHKNHL